MKGLCQISSFFLQTSLANLHKCIISVSPLSPKFQLKHVYPELLDAVADRISYDFIQVGIELGFSFKEIERFRMDHNKTVETTRAMLKEWHNRNRKESKATIGRLAHALLNTGRSDIESLVEMEERGFQDSRPTVLSVLRDRLHLSWSGNYKVLGMLRHRSRL